MSNPPIFIGKLPFKGIFPIILKGNDFKWWGQNTDRKNYIGYTYNISMIIYSKTEKWTKGLRNILFFHE